MPETIFDPSYMSCVNRKCKLALVDVQDASNPHVIGGCVYDTMEEVQRDYRGRLALARCSDRIVVAYILLPDCASPDRCGYTE